MTRRRALVTVAAVGLAACQSHPPVERGDLEQLAHRLEELRGQVVLIVLWAPWSRASVEIWPSIRELDREYGDLGLSVLGVAVEPGNEPLPAAPPSQFILQADIEAVLERFGVSDLPAALLLDRNQNLRYRLESGSEPQPLRPEDIADAIEAVLGAS